MSLPVVVYHPLPGIGDLMWHLPYIRAIATQRSDGAVVLLTRASTQAHALLKADPLISSIEFIPYVTGPVRHPRELWSTLQKLRGIKPRALWILDKISRPAIAARLLGVPEVYGYGLTTQRRWVNGPVLSSEFENAHPVEKLRAFFDAHAIPVDSTEPALVPDPESVAVLQKRFAAYPRPWVMLGVGAKNQIRRWPHAAFCELAQRLKHSGTWFAAGAPQDFSVIDREVVNAAGDARVVNVSDLDMTAIAALAGLSDLFIGNDSGPMNVAAAVGTPTIGLFGVTPPLTYSVHIRPISSSANNRTMAAITVDAVAEAASELLACDKQPCTSP